MPRHADLQLISDPTTRDCEEGRSRELRHAHCVLAAVPRAPAAEYADGSGARWSRCRPAGRSRRGVGTSDVGNVIIIKSDSEVDTQL